MSHALRASRFGFFAPVVFFAAVSALGCGARTPIELSDYEPVDLDASADVKPDILYDVVPDSAKCNPKTCSGCCDEFGSCQPGTAAGACGSGGYVCVKCTNYGAACDPNVHQCTEPKPCSPANCSVGCCDSNGLCQPGTASTNCGIGGTACVDCSASKQTCGDHKCSSVSTCGPNTCSGCCDVNGACVEGASTQACGFGGTACVNCGASGMTCSPSQHTCESAQKCGPNTCSGCCDPGTGACQTGLAQQQCGTGGTTCVACGANEPCTATGWGGGKCSGPTDCGPWNCKGCCDYNSYPVQCMSGFDQWACGGAGEKCSSCGYNETCQPSYNGGGACIAQQDCGPWNCYGCCDYNSYPPQCLGGLDQWACGTAGTACQYCSGGQSCQGIPGGGGQCSGTTDCGPWNCSGCCNYNTYPAQCMPGIDPSACGNNAGNCQVCMPNEKCEPTMVGGGACTSGGSCGPWNCSGCCDNSVYPPACTPGFDPKACGSGGQTCQPCLAAGTQCVATSSGGGVCLTSPVCGPSNCPGCCDPQTGSCLGGFDPFACGSGGMQCMVCPPGGMCQATPDGGTCSVQPACGSWNCDGCCDPYGGCQPGNANSACGVAGAACLNCQMQNQACNQVSGQCTSVPNNCASTCSGCCTKSGQCRPGYADNNCGHGGVLCEDCLASDTSCEAQQCTVVTPSNCPTPYGGCNPSLTTPPPVKMQNACSQSDLANAKNACLGDPPPPSCQMFLQKLQQTNPVCAKCLMPFYDTYAYASCVAPYLSTSCNHELTCSLDCMNMACSLCAPQDKTLCQQDLFNPGGGCSSYMQGVQCYMDALNGPAAFCGTGQTFAEWLGVVGNHYCGTGNP